MKNLIKLIACLGLLVGFALSMISTSSDVSAKNGASNYDLQNANSSNTSTTGNKAKVYRKKNKHKKKVKRHHYKSHKTNKL